MRNQKRENILCYLYLAETSHHRPSARLGAEIGDTYQIYSSSHELFLKNFAMVVTPHKAQLQELIATLPLLFLGLADAILE